jgi:peptidoglycan/LPS O-acetylase OafA/YrhL
MATAVPTIAPRTPVPLIARIPALDGLRGVAILGVLAFHTGHLRGGFLGVDLFFALSGYLITALLLRELQATGGVSLTAFWGRRLRRLFPALAAMLAVVTVVVWSVGSPDTVRAALADGPWVQLDVVNWHLLAASAGYWDRFAGDRVFEHLWSIAVEEQFYVAWPLLVLMACERGRRVQQRVAALAAGGAVASLVLMISLFDAQDPTRVYTGTDTRAFSLLLGALAATAPVAGALGRVGPRATGMALGVLVAGLAATWTLADGAGSPWLFQGGLFAHSLAAALLVAFCVQGPQARVARILAWRPLGGLGRISYGVYLWHWPVIVLLSPRATGLSGWWWTGAVCALSVGLGALSTTLVEQPIRVRARWARGRRGLLAFATVMVGLGVLWLALPAPPAPRIDTTGLR